MDSSLEKENPAKLGKTDEEYSSVSEKGYNDVDTIAADLNAVGKDVIEAMEFAKHMTDEEVDRKAHLVFNVHGGDPNFPSRVIDLARKYCEDPHFKMAAELYNELKIEMALITINSPYAEVRAVVDNHDNPNEPCLTLRAWIIGVIYVAIGAFVNQFFDIRQPGILIYSTVAQVLAYPAGELCARVLPSHVFNTFGYKWTLNPGPFNKKEHMVVTIMANVGFDTPYTANIVWVQVPDRFFGQTWAMNFGYQITTALSTNFIGYGLAGITRRFLVYPSISIWPTNLATIALNRAFHDRTHESVDGGWKISRMRWFSITFGAMFLYFWFPGYLCQAMSYFNWMTWIAPTSVTLAAITGSVTGLGINPFPTFDWNILLVSGDPLVNPFYATLNIFIGCCLVVPVICAIWWTNAFNTGYLPINSNGVFDNTGARYKVALALDENGHFSPEGYAAYSPAYLAAANIVCYTVFFAVYTATLTHTILYHRFEIWNGIKSAFRRKSAAQSSQDDVHMRLMANYKEAPEWWYFLVLCFSIGLGAAGVGAYPTHTSPAVVLYGVFLAVIFCIPCGIIKSITNQEITLNVLAELFGGLWFQGDALSMNYFKTYGYVTTAHTLRFAQDLKLAHYAHIPPRVTFWVQMIATVVSTFVAMSVVNWQMTSIPNVCAANQENGFTCPGINTFFTASVLWGTLGPRKMFGAGAIYSYTLFGFLFGAVIPIPFYFMRRKYRWAEYVHWPIMLYGALLFPPYNMSNAWPAVPIGYIFNYYIKRRYVGWWSKYNYITSGAFSSAIAISAIVIFFAVQYKEKDVNWSGNNISFSGCDGTGCPRLDIPEQGWFGPGVGEFS